MAAQPTLGVLTSGEGTTLQAIMDACRDGLLNARMGLVISNNGDSPALKRAEQAGIPTRHISTLTAGNEQVRDEQIRDQLLARGACLVLLAGYMKKVGPALLAAFPRRILNTHPALLPDFGGQGMYGDRVHRAVLESGRTRTGITLHLASGDYDAGQVIAQRAGACAAIR